MRHYCLNIYYCHLSSINIYLLITSIIENLNKMENTEEIVHQLWVGFLFHPVGKARTLQPVNKATKTSQNHHYRTRSSCLTTASIVLLSAFLLSLLYRLYTKMWYSRSPFIIQSDVNLWTRWSLIYSVLEIT